MARTMQIKKIIKSKPTIEGAGVHLKRVFGFSEENLFDPFLLLDDFRSDIPERYIKGFPWHPHRGIETITYMLAGQVEHGDSLGNSGVINPGEIQWMTAGSGIIHQEMPQGDPDGRMYGFQLWANLPAGQKMMDPRYREVKNGDIPVADVPGGAQVRVIAGEVSGVRGPVRDIVIDPEYLDVTIPAHTEFRHPVTAGHTVFAYVIDGMGYFCREKDPFTYEMVGENYFDLQREPSVPNGTLVLFDTEAGGEEVAVFTEDHSVRFLLISGKPLEEPVAWYGPIVMNTREELKAAFSELNDGSFIKYRGT